MAVQAQERSVSRRSFVKSAAATAGSAVFLGSMLSGCSSQDEEGPAGDSPVVEDEVYSGGCRGNCFQDCHINYIVRDGKVVRTEMAPFPEEKYNRICMKGLSLPERIYSPTRVLHPLKRVGERGAGEWEELTWDEAIEIICSTWKDLIATYGPASIGFSRSAGSKSSVNNYIAALQNAIGATPLEMTFDCHWRNAAKFAFGETKPACNGNDLTYLKDAKTILIWGANVTDSQVQQWHFVADAKEAGATLVCIDPLYSGTAAKSDIWVPIRPCSDGALAMAMMNIVLEKGWEDLDYLKASTVAPLLVKSDDGTYLRNSDLGGEATEDGKDFIVWDEDAGTHGLVGDVENPALHGSFEIEGVEVRTAYDLLLEAVAKYTPEYASEICDVPVETMYQITELYAANKPSSIYVLFGFDRYGNGYYSYTGVLALGMLTGNIGKPGASCGFYRPSVPVNGDVLKKESWPGASPKITSVKLPEIAESGYSGETPVPLRSLFIARCNFLSTYPGRLDMIEAFDKLDLVVYCDMRMTDTARYADIILPVCEWCECMDFHGPTVMFPYTHLQEKAVEPLGESKSDFDIVNLIAEGMGISEWFDWTIEEFLSDYLGKEHFDKLLADKTAPCSWYDGNPVVFAADGTFPTATGRAQFYFEDPINPIPPSTWYCGGELSYGQTREPEKMRLPYWEPPIEAWHENPLFEKYPIIMQCEHSKWHTQSQFGYVKTLRELDGGPMVRMSAEDAAARGISEGDIVRVFNDRGSVTLKATISNGYRPGVANIPHGWAIDQFIEGHSSDLMTREMNVNVSNAAYTDNLAQIEKVEA